MKTLNKSSLKASRPLKFVQTQNFTKNHVKNSVIRYLMQAFGTAVYEIFNICKYLQEEGSTKGLHNDNLIRKFR